MIIRGAVIVLCTQMLVGCISLALDSDREPMHTHLLNPGWKGETIIHTASTPSAAVLLITRPQTQSGYDTPQMAYLRRPHEIEYYATHRWVDSPPRMLAPLLVQAMERTGAWKAVVQAPTIVAGDYRLESDQFIIEQLFFEQPNRVRIALRAQLFDLKQYGVIGSKSFEVFEVSPSEDANGAATAANRGTERLLDDLANWASACAQHSEC